MQATKPQLRIIAGRPANVPWVNREPEKPRDAVDFMDNVRLVVFAILVLVAVALLCVFVFSLEKLS